MKRDFEFGFKVFVQFILFYITELYKTYILVFENKLIIAINQLILYTWEIKYERYHLLHVWQDCQKINSTQ